MVLFEGDAAIAEPREDMAPRGKWPPFPWNPSDLDNPLIGRDDALRALTYAFEDVVSAWTVRVQLLVSEYGIGKERLTAAFVERARERERNTIVVRIRCPVSGGPYRLWDTILREAFDIAPAADEAEAGALLLKGVQRFLTEDAAEVASLIAYLVGYEVPGRPVLQSGADEEALTARCLGAIGRLLEAVAHERPLLIVVSRANRASARDFALASAIEATVKGRPIMMVFAGSPELTDHLPGWDRFPVTRLAPLDVEDADRMLRLFLSGLKNPAPRPLVDRILSNAQGNPYALKSMVRYLQEAGGIVEQDDGWAFDHAALSGIHLPDNLEGMIRARVGALEPAERQVLAQAAVIGRQLWLGALVALARHGADEVPHELDEGEEPSRIRKVLRKFVEQRFIEARTSQIPGEEAFVFRSRLHWRVAHEILPTTVRARHHRVVGSWLLLQAEDNEAPFLLELARHAEGAGHPGDAAVYYLRAARIALEEHHSNRALESLEAAQRLVQTDQIATRMNILFELGNINAFAGAIDDAKRYYSEALELAWRMRDRRHGARALVMLADVEQTRGEFELAKAHLENGMRLYEVTQDQFGVASSSTALGQLHWLQGNFEHALRCYRKGEHIYRELGNSRGLGDVFHAMGTVYYDRGDAALAERFYETALTHRRAVNDRRGLAKTYNNLGIVWMGQKLERAVEVWKEALSEATDIGDLGLEATLADNLGEACVLLGRFDESRTYLMRAVHLAELTGRKRTLVDALRNLALLRTALGEWEAAEEALNAAREHASRLGLARLDALVERAVGDLAVARMEATGIIAEDGGPKSLSSAEAAYRRAAEGFEKAGYDMEAAISHERLAETLELAGRKQEAAASRAHAAQLRAEHARPVDPPPLSV